MSVLGYFGRRRGELRMRAQVDVPGIRFSGPVLTGVVSVEGAREREAARVAGKVKGAPPQDYDPVLRAHCRFDEEG